MRCPPSRVAPPTSIPPCSIVWARGIIAPALKHCATARAATGAEIYSAGASSSQIEIQRDDTSHKPPRMNPAAAPAVRARCVRQRCCTAVLYGGGCGRWVRGTTMRPASCAEGGGTSRKTVGNCKSEESRKGTPPMPCNWVSRTCYCRWGPVVGVLGVLIESGWHTTSRDWAPFKN